MAVRIIIADDHEIFRTGLQASFKGSDTVTIIAQAENGEVLLEQVEKYSPDLVLTDIQMPKVDGIQACTEIKKKHHDVPVIALTGFNETSLLVEMLRAGASGILLKEAGKVEILSAIDAIMCGGTHFSFEILDKLRGLVKGEGENFVSTNKTVLSQREQDVIIAICEGLSSKEIGAKLNISARTVEGHKVRIQEKTQSRSLANLIIYAIRNRLFRI